MTGVQQVELVGHATCSSPVVSQAKTSNHSYSYSQPQRKPIPLSSSLSPRPTSHPNTTPHPNPPTPQDLHHPAMRDRHWRMLMGATGRRFVMDGRFRLGDLLALELHHYVDACSEIVDRWGLWERGLGAGDGFGSLG
jgi:hypothetical protein